MHGTMNVKLVPCVGSHRVLHFVIANSALSSVLIACKFFCVFCFLDRAFSIMKTKINQQNAQINSGLIYY